MTLWTFPMPLIRHFPKPLMKPGFKTGAHTRSLPVKRSRLAIEQGCLRYTHLNGALTTLNVDELISAELRVLRGETYWYLNDANGSVALIPEVCPQIGILRRYLSALRGFNYDGLVRFDADYDTELQLWPVEREKRRA